jgi:hypothetical protein
MHIIIGVRALVRLLPHLLLASPPDMLLCDAGYLLLLSYGLKVIMRVFVPV